MLYKIYLVSGVFSFLFLLNVELIPKFFFVCIYPSYLRSQRLWNTVSKNIWSHLEMERLVNLVSLNLYSVYILYFNLLCCLKVQVRTWSLWMIQDDGCCLQILIDNKQYYKFLGRNIDMVSLIKLYLKEGKIVRHEDWYVLIYWAHCFLLSLKKKKIKMTF